MRHTLTLTGVILSLLFVSLFASAQETGQGTSTVTADQVNAIAAKLYCPVCENIPLDACGTAACADWRNEIKLQLEQGMTEAQITDDFVRRFGDRVVGTPQDPLLRILSLVTPWLLIGLGGAGGVWFLLRQRIQTATPITQSAPQGTQAYYDQLERDLQG